MGENKYPGPDRRKYFRIEYPPEARPLLTIGKKTFPVMDISEKGIRFLNDKQAKFADWVKGVLTFHDGDALEFEGKIVWERGGELGVQIVVTPIPPARVFAEQRYLVSREKQN